MPIMDGPSAALRLRESGFTGRIVGFSGLHSLAVTAFKSSGVTTVLQKPLVKADIKSILEGETTT